MMLCPKCGKENRDGSKFCTICGTSLLNTAANAAGNINPNMPANAGANNIKRKSIVPVIVAVCCTVLILAVVLMSLYFFKTMFDKASEAEEKAAAAQAAAAQAEAERRVTAEQAAAAEAAAAQAEADRLQAEEQAQRAKDEAAAAQAQKTAEEAAKKEAQEKAEQAQRALQAAEHELSQSQTETILYCCASDYATLRATPSTKASPLATISTRGAVTLIDVSGEWYKVRYNGKVGYVLAKFFSTDRNAALNYDTR